MKVAVAGLWHLGTVTAACCAAGDHRVVAFDDDETVIDALRLNRLPVEEPGLAELISSETKAGRLRFTSDPSDLDSPQVLWICYDTPVDENDMADTDFVLSRIEALLTRVPGGALVLISSQLPVGSTARLEKVRPDLQYAYSPENLRLGDAIRVFTQCDRVVAGIRTNESRETLVSLFAPFTDRLEWMSIESAEMTKHALNAFLATSVAFINEIATICEKTGADAQEVERGLKSEARIGAKAYLHPGAAFAGGTLARDITFLRDIAQAHHISAHLLRGVWESNVSHQQWARHRLLEILPNLDGKTIAVLGLAYKAGTNTLRRSSAVEFCRWMSDHQATVRAFDPAVKSLPSELKERIELAGSVEALLDGADAVLVATPWAEFQTIPAELFSHWMRRPLVLDPGRYLETNLKACKNIEYLTIGVGL